MLRDRRIVVGVCGGIAAYKAADVVSKLQQAGALVDVVLTHHATDFVQPLTFATLSHRPVYQDLWEASGQAAARHIELAESAEVLLVAPATADSIARLAQGRADDMLAAVALATRAPLVVVPAMEHHMYEHPATQANLRLLAERGATIVPPEMGHLASGMVGMGRFPETPVILGWVRSVLGRTGDLAGRRVVVTAGGTHEPIDPVRFVGNRSSGLMGYALAEEARDRGAQVVLISGPVALPPPAGLRVEAVNTAMEMRDAVLAGIEDADALVMAAAVADYRVEHPAAQKIKKGSAAENRDGSLSLHLVRNPDILAEMARKSSGTGLIRVGFAAETADLAANATAKLNGKGLHLLVANDVAKAGSGFGTPTNEVTIFHTDGRIEQLALLPKHDVAAAIWDRVVPLLRARPAAATPEPARGARDGREPQTNRRAQSGGSARE